MAQQQGTVFDFDNMSDNQKAKEMIKIILKMSNFKADETLDWSNEKMELHVPTAMVVGFLGRLNSSRIVSELVGKKTAKQISDVIFNIKPEPEDD